MRQVDADVVVVGGGPAGAVTAALLATRGHDVILFDKAAFPREKPCGEFISPGVVEIFRRLQIPISSDVRHSARPRGMRVHTRDGQFCLDFVGASKDGEAALGVTRRDLDLALLSWARRSGARIHERTIVRGTAIENGRVVGVDVGTGRPYQRFHARVVVGADGHHSTIARSLGLDYQVDWPRRIGLVARYEGVGGLDGFGEMHVGRGAYCGLAPVGDGVVTVGLVVPMASKQKGGSVEQLYFRGIGQLPTVSEALRTARRLTKIRGVAPLARGVVRVAGPGYLLVGDAAGFFDPFTGEGVYRAVRGAEIAADVVDEALRRDPSGARGIDVEREYAGLLRQQFAAKDRVCLLIQLFLQSESLFTYVARRLAERHDLRTVLAGVLGDRHDARSALRPRYLWSLLRP